jgi:hypothetical protein
MSAHISKRAKIRLLVLIMMSSIMAS